MLMEIRYKNKRQRKPIRTSQAPFRKYRAEEERKILTLTTFG